MNEEEDCKNVPGCLKLFQNQFFAYNPNTEKFFNDAEDIFGAKKFTSLQEIKDFIEENKDYEIYRKYSCRCTEEEKRIYVYAYKCFVK